MNIPNSVLTTRPEAHPSDFLFLNAFLGMCKFFSISNSSIFQILLYVQLFLSVSKFNVWLLKREKEKNQEGGEEGYQLLKSARIPSYGRRGAFSSARGATAIATDHTVPL